MFTDKEHLRAFCTDIMALKCRAIRNSSSIIQSTKVLSNMKVKSVNYILVV